MKFQCSSKAGWAVAFMVFVLFWAIVALMPAQPNRTGDGASFHAPAMALAKQVRGIEQPAEYFEIRRAPGPVFYYFVPYLLLPPQAPSEAYVSAGIFWSMLMVMGSVFLVWRTLLLILKSSEAAFFGVVLFFVMPLPIYYAQQQRGQSPVGTGLGGAEDKEGVPSQVV